MKRFNLNPGFMKIDTEGAELLVLRGATETLRTNRPVILSELNDSLLAATGSTRKWSSNCSTAQDTEFSSVTMTQTKSLRYRKSARTQWTPLTEGPAPLLDLGPLYLFAQSIPQAKLGP